MIQKMKQKKLIVFDMDGVLIDVSMSYRDTARQTARLFFSGARGWKDLPDPLFPLADLARVKQSGGLNNDWDLTWVVISLLYSQVKGPGVLHGSDPWPDYRASIARCDVSGLARFLNAESFPLTTLMERIGKPSVEFVSALYAGDVGSGNIIKQIFQEIYLGPDLFRATYGISPEACRESGYIDREKLLIDRSILERLSGRYLLAIATGRPKAEAEYPLDRFRIRTFFSAMVTLDDCLREEERILEAEKRTVSLSKPDPYMLDAIAAAFEGDVDGRYYIGDMPDDMVAAAGSSAGFAGIGILLSAPDRASLAKDLRAAGAVAIIDDFESLAAILEADTD